MTLPSTKGATTVPYRATQRTHTHPLHGHGHGPDGGGRIDRAPYILGVGSSSAFGRWLPQQVATLEQAYDIVREIYKLCDFLSLKQTLTRYTLYE